MRPPKNQIKLNHKFSSPLANARPDMAFEGVESGTCSKFASPQGALEEEQVEEEEEEEDEVREAQEKDDEKEEEEGDYQLRFEGEMDPLALAEDDGSGVQPYQQFQRLEYEALAARKRKMLARQGVSDAKKVRQQDVFGATMDEIWEATTFGLGRRRSHKPKKRGRQKLLPGSRGPRLPPALTKKLGDANLLYAMSKFDEAVELLKEVVRFAPNVPDPYHTLGLVYDAMGNRKKAINFYMIAAHLTPKDASLWKRLASWSMEEGSTGQVVYCLQKAVRAEPEDMHAKWDLGSFYVGMKDYSKAAEIFEQILALHPSDVEVCKMVAKVQHKCGHFERATETLEKLINEYPTEADLTAVNLLAALYMKNKEFSAAISCIEHARTMYCAGKGLPLDLAVKAGICHACLENRTVAEKYFEGLGKEQVEEHSELILEAGDAYLQLEEYQLALKYYGMLEGNPTHYNGGLWKKMAECHVAMEDQTAAIKLYRQVVDEMPQDVDMRLTLASLLVENDQQEEALKFLLPPQPSGVSNSKEEPQWFQDGRVKMKQAQIYHMQGKIDLFLETILPSIQDTLFVESLNQKVKGKKRLSKRVLSERVKWLDNSSVDTIFHCFGPMLSQNDKLKAERARKALAKLEAKKSAAIGAGIDWPSDDNAEEELAEGEKKVAPLPNLFDDEEHYQLLVQTCKTLATLKRHWDALEIINQTLKVGHSYVVGKRDELRALGAEITYKASDTKYGYDCVRYMVQRFPYSINAWNRYYRTVSKSECRVPKHNKFMLAIRAKYPDCVPAMLIHGHKFSMINQPQGALCEYLHAYKVQPDDPFINLCIGVSFINLSLCFRVTNRNQCILQGFAFLYNYQRLTNSCQESNYNLARAYHHVGLVHLAVTYYEKVLSHREKDLPMVKLPEDSSLLFDDATPEVVPSQKTSYGCCDLRREAAHNLHLIYRKSGALNLARQVLQDYCTP